VRLIGREIRYIKTCRVCYWNIKFEHQNNKRALENLLQKIVGPEYTENPCKEIKIQNKKIVLRNMLR